MTSLNIRLPPAAISDWTGRCAFMDHRERDIIIRKKMLGEIADIESFVNGMKEEDFSQ